LFSSKQWESSSLGRATRRSVILAQLGVDNVILVKAKLGTIEEHPPVGIPFNSYRNCPLDVWRFSPTRQYLICHRSGLLGDRVGCALDFKLTHCPRFGYAKFRSRSHDAVIRVYDAAGNVIETHEHAGKFKEP
jgi:hypothetical protein